MTVGVDAYDDYNEESEDDKCNAEEKEELQEVYSGISSMTWGSHEAAYQFYNNFAKQRGFSVRKGTVKRSKGPGNEVKRKRFLCSRQGERDEKLLTMENRTRRLRPLTRCNCKAHLIVKRDISSGKWIVHSLDDVHNHRLASKYETPFLRSHRKIKDHQKAEILAMEAEGIPKTTIVRMVCSTTCHWSKVGWVRKDCYNLCGRVKRKLVQKGDAVTVIEMMNARKQKDPEFYFDYQLDEIERLKTLFWCDSQSCRDYAEYGDILVFDSTYKMNR